MSPPRCAEGSGGGGYAKVMSEGFQKAQRDMYAKEAKDADIIITTALIPGKPAPKLITAEMVTSMKPGSVIVDMAAEQGGNCELTEPGEAIMAAMTLADRLAKGPADAQAAIKRLLTGWHALAFEAQLAAERDAMAHALAAREAGEGITAFCAAARRAGETS